MHEPTVRQRHAPVQRKPHRAKLRGLEVRMPEGGAGGAGLGWLLFSLMTVVTWGLYGVFLHQGQTSMQDPVNGRYRAFLFVGIAYMVTAVLAPLAILVAR